MNVLVACEFSGAVRDAFLARGHYAMSCDLEPSDSDKGDHHQGDVLEVLDWGWDLMLAFPDCKFLCSSGLHWNKVTPGRADKTEAALLFVLELMVAPIPKKLIENSVGCISTRIRRPDQIVHPYMFGDDASKQTCFWLDGLPILEKTGPFVEPRYVNGLPRWGNQLDSGQNRLGPSEDRAKIRSTTFPGIANALAGQYG